MFNRTAKKTGAVGLMLASALLLVACAGPQTAVETQETGPSASEETSTPNTPTDTSGDATTLDCAPFGDAIISLAEASFSAASTSVTNAEVAAAWDEAIAKTRLASDPGGDQWQLHLDVLDRYSAEWHALPPGDGALGNAQTIEDTVDAFAASIGYDFDEMTRVVGEQCGDELQGLFAE